MKMLRDASALVNIQVALMGIVLVVGLFYLWKMLKGLENKVNRLSASVSKLQEQLEARGAAPTSDAVNAAAEDAMAAAFMNEVFGGSAPPTFLHAFGGPSPAPKTANVVVLDTETTEDGPSEPANVETVEEPAGKAFGSIATIMDADLDADTASVVTTSVVSKSKVRKMSAEALRELCKERGLDTEGTRAVLMERVLATLDD